MKKLNTIIYNKLKAQAEEAKEIGLVKLADNIISAIGEDGIENSEEYSYQELQADANQELWKVASNVIKYYDIKSADAEKIQNVLLNAFAKLEEELQLTLNIESKVGPLEPKVPGENK
jgi:hypothetical protein